MDTTPQREKRPAHAPVGKDSAAAAAVGGSAPKKQRGGGGGGGGGRAPKKQRGGGGRGSGKKKTPKAPVKYTQAKIINEDELDAAKLAALKAVRRCLQGLVKVIINDGKPGEVRTTKATDLNTSPSAAAALRAMKGVEAVHRAFLSTSLQTFAGDSLIEQTEYFVQKLEAVSKNMNNCNQFSSRSLNPSVFCCACKIP